MAPSRFQYFTPPLRRLKTAFSPDRTYAASASSTSTTSPLSLSQISDESDFSPVSGASASSSFSAARMRALLMLRRKPSTLDVELEEEKRSFAAELGLLEPRPQMPMGVAIGGIFEVLEGRF